jgi:hypothetical protein
MVNITNEDLHKNQYDMETLKSNIYAVSLLEILKTQKLTADFCVKYILNPNFQLLDDEKITKKQVIQWQPHLTENQLSCTYMYLNMTRERIDSFEDFESFSKR